MPACPPTIADQVRAVPGVASASAFVRSTGTIDEPRNAPFDEDGAPLLGVDAQGADGTAPVRLTSGSLAGLTGSTVALPEYVAGKIHRGVGSTISMTLGDGTPVTLRVVATFAAERGYENIILPASLLAPHTTDGLTKQLLVRTAPGADVGPALAKLAAAHPGVQVADRDSLVAANAEDLQTQAWVNYMLVGMLIAYTAVSVVNTLVSSTLRRRREFALQRLTGSTRMQVLRMLWTESTLVTLAGITLGHPGSPGLPHPLLGQGLHQRHPHRPTLDLWRDRRSRRPPHLRLDPPPRHHNPPPLPHPTHPHGLKPAR